MLALITRKTKWPGPMTAAFDKNAARTTINLALGDKHLFPSFLRNVVTVSAGLFFFFVSFLASLPAFNEYVYIKSPFLMLMLDIIAFSGAHLAFKQADSQRKQVVIFLQELKTEEEPRTITGQSAEAEYSIEHPLSEGTRMKGDRKRALDLFCAGTRLHQEGEQWQGMELYQQALVIDPQLHQHAREQLTMLAQRCAPGEEGPIYYWLGIHSEYMLSRIDARDAYEKSILAFSQLGHRHREARAHCNLGNVKMQMMDGTAIEEFEKAVELNPRNGTAHLNIGRAYYSISEEGDPRYDLALEAFAQAMLADPLIYGPQVVASLKQFGYRWKEDLEKIIRIVETKGH